MKRDIPDPISLELAVRWFKKNVREKSPASLTTETGKKKIAELGLSLAPVDIGGGYPTASNLDEAEQLTRIEKNKCQIAKYQAKIIESYNRKRNELFVTCFAEIKQFLVEECGLTQEKSAKFNQLIDKLILMLNAG
jgi:hypothetical protein